MLAPRFPPSAVKRCVMATLRHLRAIQQRIKRAYALCEAEILPQMNWQDVGREVRKQFIARVNLPCSCNSCIFQDTPRGRRQNYWSALVFRAIDGDPSVLVRHLRSRRKLTRFDRNELARLFEYAFTKALQHKPTTKGGRPKHSWARMCADVVAINFYQDWKDANRRNGINDWGHRDEMKDEASRLAIELGSCWARRFTGQDPPTFEQVRELMERPAARRR
jgi:hypothetical protein